MKRIFWYITYSLRLSFTRKRGRRQRVRESFNEVVIRTKGMEASSRVRACMYMYTYVHAFSARARVFVEYIFSFAFRASLFLARCPIRLNEIKVSLPHNNPQLSKLYLICIVFSTETRNLCTALAGRRIETIRVEAMKLYGPTSRSHRIQVTAKYCNISRPEKMSR